MRLPRVAVVEDLASLNPGIGGSEFHSIQLSLELALAGFNVSLLFEGERPRLPDSVRLIHCESSKLRSKDFDILITSVGWVPRLVDLGLTFIPTIVISHHPHDGNLLNSWSSLSYPKMLVNVGRYQLLSNLKKGIPSVWLPAFTNPPSLGQEPVPEVSLSKLRVGHISSLHPSKGFHIALMGWMRFAKTLAKGSTSLTVLGTSKLYGSSHVTFDNGIPVDGPYGRKLNKIISLSPIALQDNIQFLGLVEGSVDESVKRWEVAIQNPIGLAEADPMVVQDCLRCGVPVIGSSLFGMYDYTRYFPELRAHTPWGISRKLKLLRGNPRLLRRLQIRAVSIYEELFERRSRTVVEWINLLDQVANNLPLSAGISVGEVESRLRVSLFLGRAVNWAAITGERLKKNLEF